MSAVTDWTEANQAYLVAALGLVREALAQHAVGSRGSAEAEASLRRARALLDDVARALPAPAALDRVCRSFGLSAFERDVLLLCAGVELEAGFGALCASAQGDPGRAYPTFSLALAALPDAHWSALTPAAPLRRWRLVEVQAAPGQPLTRSPLRIDECVLHYLAGAPHPDERLAGLVEPVEPAGDLVPSHRAVAEQVVELWSTLASSGLPVVLLRGADAATNRDIASAACQLLGLACWELAGQAVPTHPAELDALLRLWERYALLTDSVLLVDCDGIEAPDAAREQALATLMHRLHTPVVVSGRERRAATRRQMVTFEVGKPSLDEQRALWEASLGQTGSRLNGQLDAVVGHFNLGAPTIRAASSRVLTNAGSLDDRLPERLWDACRVEARPRLDDLAERIDPRASWDDLVLPDAQKQLLREIAIHVRHRGTVYERWGFAARSGRGLGISALFSGPSGTGKTMAGEVLANELRLDLYRIDLSQVVSKYIGETEKNLRRAFDGADDGGAILLFDEADALFGKRSEVRDSHDRYANIEVSYLLQRMESYRGLAVLTTNNDDLLDAAFMRRLRFVVRFVFPGATQRAAMWRLAFPHHVPLARLDLDRLAQLSVTGAMIQNIALYAASLAASGCQPVSMEHIWRAAKAECAKYGRQVTDLLPSGSA